MATALRYDTVLTMPFSAIDKVTGRVVVETKGGKQMLGRINPKGMAHTRRYVQHRARLATDCPALFPPLRRTARPGTTREDGARPGAGCAAGTAQATR